MKSSDSAGGLKGNLPLSTRDILAAHIAAAMFLKGGGMSTRPASSYGSHAYEYADQML